MKRELEQIIVTDANNLWREVVNKTDLDVEAVVPVEMVDPESNTRLGSFHASFVKEDSKIYLQLEDFDTPEWAEMFFQIYEGEWEVCLGGIYRMEL
ncbi:MAG: hypothetical protein HYV90_03345 [Candidatus Woesebacteria bacterium]|nr:MAG: hypothetical protein HYV90_03345 [Candidatus Woesebacteria bacterium]